MKTKMMLLPLTVALLVGCTSFGQPPKKTDAVPVVLCIPIADVVKRLEDIASRCVTAADDARVRASFYPNAATFQIAMGQRINAFEQSAEMILIEIKELEKSLPAKPDPVSPVIPLDRVTK